MQTDTDMKAPGDRHTMNVFAKLDNDECILKYIDYGKQADKVKEDYQNIHGRIQSELCEV